MLQDQPVTSSAPPLMTQSHQFLEQSVLTVCALLLPVSCDGGPHPTQHAAPETATRTMLPWDIYMK